MKIKWLLIKQRFWMWVSEISCLSSEFRLMAGLKGLKISFEIFRLEWSKGKNNGLGPDSEER